MSMTASADTAILLADDEPANHILAGAVMARHGWALDGVNDGEAAVRAVAAGKYAVVLMDIDMPRMDGYAATAAIRGGESGGPAIIAFTAVRVADALHHFRSRGMDDYLAKPFTAESLCAAVARWLPATAPSPQTRLEPLLGADVAHSLLYRFREQLAEALETIDRREGQESSAHRLGGLAGTLGFGPLASAWIAISEGDESAREAARVESRKALVLLDRGAESRIHL